jgi:peptidoglycan/xylan/chitin deacetylase (PgdA/CDA1 family)
MRKWISSILIVLFVVGVLSALMPTAPVTAQTSPYWDFEDHTVDHAHLSQLTDDQIRWEMEQVNAAFIAHGYEPPKHLAYPYGDYGKNAKSQARIKAIVSQYRLSGRVVFGEMETYPIADWYVHKAAQLKSATGWSKIKGWVDECIATNSLLHIFTHDVSAKPSSYGCTPEKLAQLLDYLVEKQNAGQLVVMTMAEAYDYWTTTTNPKPTVVISFDDANRSDFTTVYPLFKARGLKGTSYIVTGFIDTADHLTWADIAQMVAGT